MALTPGARLGPYEISAQIGVGGMGEVYRARDTKLNRDVAIKILPDSFATDPDRLARFTREAQVLASLNHPNIAHIHDLEESNGVRALVMELVEGEDLAQRIARGAIPLDESLPIATQIAEALEAAHEQGIIHRDLKPANIKVRDDGTVKVLDFGLAKAMEPAAGSSPNVTQSPTITTPAMTLAGIVLGTAAYMSPEQARGRPVDKRTDIWAFGAVLYEMLTGIRAFDGEDATEVIAAVVKTTPDWTRLPAEVPPRIVTLIQRCLEKDRKARIGDIAAAQFVLQESAPDVSSARTTAQRAPVPLWRAVLPWALASVAIMGIAVALWAPWRHAVPRSALSRLSVELGADVSLVTTAGPGLILSPDGNLLIFVGEKAVGARPQLYARPLNQLHAVPLAGTEGARNPFFSPDGRWVAFFSQGKLKKTPVAGGGTLTICDAADDRGGAWADDGTIVFAPENRGMLWRVPAAGGKPEPLTSFAEGEVTHRWPQVLPGSKAIVFTAHDSTVIGYEDASVVVQLIAGGERKVVQRGGFHGRYLSSGHLTYLHEGTVFAAPFDLSRLDVTGSAEPVLQGVSTNRAPGGVQLAVSGSGTAAYLPGPFDLDERPISWMNRQGQTTPLRASPSIWRSPRFSPDGSRLALEISEGKNRLVSVYDLARDTLMRLTFDATNSGPIWTPDGKRIAFVSNRADGINSLYWQRADGTGEAQRLTFGQKDSYSSPYPDSWHPSGQWLAFDQSGSGGRDIMMLPIEGDEVSGWTPGEPKAFLATPAREEEAVFSPDGKWIAYQSTESGPREVYVRPYPGPGGKWQISSGGGGFPVWSRTRHELLYSVLQTTSIMVVSYTFEGDSFRPEKPRPWSDARVVGERGNLRGYDLHPDGERLAVAPLQEQAEAKRDKVVFVFNFFDELPRTAAAAQR